MSSIVRTFHVVSVSLYLGVVLLYLRATKKVKAPRILPLLRAKFRPPYQGELRQFAHESGNCYVAPIPPEVISDRDGYSRIVVLEDGKPLRMGHASHQVIREEGKGAYSHWGTDVFFATSDNTNPAGNGRRYQVVERL